MRFGGYLQDDIDTLSTLQMIRTTDINSWQTQLSNVQINYIKLKHFDSRMALIDPGVPFCYIPENDFVSLMEMVAELMPNFQCNF